LTLPEKLKKKLEILCSSNFAEIYSRDISSLMKKEIGNYYPEEFTPEEE